MAPEQSFISVSKTFKSWIYFSFRYLLLISFQDSECEDVSEDDLQFSPEVDRAKNSDDNGQSIDSNTDAGKSIDVEDQFRQVLTDFIKLRTFKCNGWQYGFQE